MGVLGGANLGRTIELRACATAQLIFVAHHGSLLAVGALDAGTPFEVHGDGPMGSLRVSFPRLWLEASEDNPLALPAAAGACPASGVDAPSQAGIFGAGV